MWNKCEQINRVFVVVVNKQQPTNPLFSISQLNYHLIIISCQRVNLWFAGAWRAHSQALSRLWQLSPEWSFWLSRGTSSPRIALYSKKVRIVLITEGICLLTLTLELLSLDVRYEEWWHEVLNDDLWLVSSLLHSVNKLVQGFCLELGLLVSL